MTKTKTFALNGLIAAIYVALTLFLPLSFGSVQFRVSEALCLLPALNKKTAIGVTLGCFISNILGAASGLNPIGLIDSVVGTLATLLSCLAVVFLSKLIKKKWVKATILPLPVVLLNAVIIGLELCFVYPPLNLVKFLSFGASVAIGEIAVVYTLGNMLLLGNFIKFTEK